MYEYKGKIVRVVDADTLDIEVDLGFCVSVRERFRLLGVDAPETFGPRASDAGRAAKAYVEAWVANNGPDILLKSHKTMNKDKYGRWLALVVGRDEACLNENLVGAGHAKVYLP